MSVPRNHANSNTADARHHASIEDKAGGLWSPDEGPEPGRNWFLILLFVFVPLAALVSLILCLYALADHLIGTP